MAAHDAPEFLTKLAEAIPVLWGSIKAVREVAKKLAEAAGEKKAGDAETRTIERLENECKEWEARYYRLLDRYEGRPAPGDHEKPS